MIRRVVHTINELLGRNAPGNRFTVFDDDVFITSYPKSGNTWTRFLIANLIHPQEPVTFLNIGGILPDPVWQSRNVLKSCPRPRVIKSHHPFDPRYKKVIFIVRDPRDIVLSQHFFQIKRGIVAPDTPMEEFVPRFVRGETSDYGSWGQNVGSWLIARHHTPGFLLLRYEDMIVRPVEELAKIAVFLGRRPDRGELARAVELSSADQMRKLEEEQADKWVVTKATRKDMPFMRSAKAGGWKSSLPSEAVGHIERAWGNLMLALGYELVEEVPKGADRTLLDLIGIPLDAVRE
ncbi:MAG: sulfotransferase domain-containing protein [Terriglobales bacterium]